MISGENNHKPSSASSPNVIATSALNMSASNSPVIAKIVKSVVFCENPRCVMFCHIDCRTSVNDNCPLCRWALVSFCKYCSLFEKSRTCEPTTDATSIQHNNSSTIAMIGTNSSAQQLNHDVRQSFHVQTLVSTARRPCHHLDACPNRDHVPLDTQIKTLLAALRVLQFELSYSNKTKDVDGFVLYKMRLLSNREQELLKIQKRLFKEKDVKRSFRQSIRTNDMDRIARLHFEKKNELDRSMASYLEQAEKRKLKKGWELDKIKIDSIYPNQGPHNERTRVLLHVSNCSRILYPEQIDVALQTNGLLLKAEIVSITKHSIRCIFPKVEHSMEVQVIIDSDFSDLPICNNLNIKYTYTRVDSDLPRVSNKQTKDRIANPLNQNLAFESIRTGELHFLKELLSTDPRKYLVERDNFDRTILHFACAMNNYDIVSYLFAVYGRYFDHLQFGDHYKIFKMLDVNGCNIFNIAVTYKAKKVVKFLRQYLPDDRAVRSDMEPSVFNLIMDYFPQIPSLSTNYLRTETFDIPVKKVEENVTMTLEELPTIKSIVNRQQLQYQVCLLKRVGESNNRIVIPGGDLLRRDDADDRFNYMSVVLTCIQYRIKPRSCHLLFIKTCLERDDSQSIQDLVSHMSIHRTQFDLTEPELPQLESTIDILCQLISCKSSHILSQLT